MCSHPHSSNFVSEFTFGVSGQRDKSEGVTVLFTYSNVPNKRAYTFINGKVCLFGSIKVMALPVMEFQDQGYKIRKIFA